MADDTEEAAPVAVAEPAPAIEPQPEPEPVEPVDATLAGWVDEHIRNSPVSRATEAWNHLMAVLPHLAAKLKEH